MRVTFELLMKKFNTGIDLKLFDQIYDTYAVSNQPIRINTKKWDNDLKY